MTVQQHTQQRLAVAGGSPVAASPVPMLVVRLEDDEKQRVMDVLDSGMLAQGSKCAEFETRFAEADGAKFAITCSSGTTALQLAYEALIQPGDDVLVPAWTFVATASMVLARDATPVWVDVDPRTYNFDVADARKRLTPNTRAVVATHLYGNPADIDNVTSFAKEHGLKVIFDAAQAHLARYDGQPIGCFGDASTYSFYATKNMTCGEGGMITTNNADLADRLRAVRSHGETTKYRHDLLGYNYRMNDMTAAIGLVQLGKLPGRTERRQSIAARYDAGLADLPGVQLPQATPGAEHVYHLYTLQLDPALFTCDRDAFIEALRAEGIGCAVHYPGAASRQPLFAHVTTDQPPISDGLGSRVVSIPVHPSLTDEQVEDVIAAVRKVAHAYRGGAG
ncbi:MAG: DegT/DnrJ/EryC1/StrS family aminotransferase [Phycisphaerales bacterium]|nr:DegT/DnrJ/EryC1/StrS family aminotransferase [Phycisphaerales bacterium]